MDIEINFRNIKNHSNLVQQCVPLFNIPEGTDQINLHLDLTCAFIRSDFLLLLTAALKNLDEQGIEINGDVTANEHNVGYAMRMNFFEHIGADYHESFVRRDHKDRFLEITQFDGSDFKVVERISAMLVKHAHLDMQTVSLLDFALGELTDNIRHSLSFNGGWAVAQYVEGLNRIRAIVADTGIGIHNSLTSNEDYRDLTPVETLTQCIQQGVTGDTNNGMGNGLFLTSEFVKKNKGIMKIHSGNVLHSISRGKSYISESHFWEGTYVYLEINTNNPVVASDILGNDANYNVFMEQYGPEGDGLEDLW